MNIKELKIGQVFLVKQSIFVQGDGFIFSGVLKKGLLLRIEQIMPDAHLIDCVPVDPRDYSTIQSISFTLHEDAFRDELCLQCVYSPQV